MSDKLTKEDLKFIFPSQTEIDWTIKEWNNWESQYNYSKVKAYINGHFDNENVLVTIDDDVPSSVGDDHIVHYKSLLNTRFPVFVRNYNLWKVMKENE